MAKGAKATNDSRKKVSSTKELADGVTSEYGKILARADFEYTPSLQMEMAKLVGPEKSDSYFNLVAGGMSLLIVILLMASNDFLPLAVVLVFATVAVLSLSRNFLRLKVRWLDRRGYAASAFQKGSQVHVFATETHVVVAMPDGSKSAYPLSELKRVRNNENNCVASFGKGRLALFPRKPMGAAGFNLVVDLLNQHAPLPWAARLAQGMRGSKREQA